MKNLYEIDNKLYIINSFEQVNPNDYYITTSNTIAKADVGGAEVANKNKRPKVILTTNNLLIKDGVQAIDDEFLEWFVKNPNCERVETQVEFIQTPDNLKDGFYYKIIIPREEPKPHSFCETPEEKCTMNYCDENGCLNRKRELVEPKQETLEEATEKLSKNAYKKHSVKDDTLSLDEQIQRSGGFIVGFKEGMKEGAKWQAERMYSEEEVYSLLEQSMKDCHLWELDEHYSGDYKNLKEWFEQFKKK